MIDRQMIVPVLILTCLAGCGGNQGALSATPILTSAPTPTVTPLPTETPTPIATLMPTSLLPLSGNGGGVIVFYSERGGNAEIYVMNADGSDPRRLTYNDADDNSPAWSPDGTKIAFVSDRNDPDPSTCFPNCNYELYVMNEDGSDQRQLTDTPAAEYHPDWSPDGSQLMFDSDRDGDGNGEIYVIDLDGGEERQLTNGEANDRWADWSPDGMQIIFSSNRDGNYEIYVMKADGSNQQRLTDSDMDELFPAWSPDGSQIAFFNMPTSSDKQDIYVMNADGSHVRRLTERPYTVDEDPAWSPNGEQIVFQSNRDGNYEIYVMNADGSDQRHLTNSSTGEFWPAWRP